MSKERLKYQLEVFGLLAAKYRWRSIDVLNDLQQQRMRRLLAMVAKNTSRFIQPLVEVKFNTSDYRNTQQDRQ
ncbi:hypothetical protein [Aliterella atlantica]|uniref:Uncharacterized protein n=1 Tax=Aliterella atlantica CENA595 TaxID=1618023 RepID=A0A0D8ZPN3_9CYAN|nr:hypothetical protein [Aliterella atlantica]KJH70675.1 hypothetical protein UH38_16570 [Aliterella atlantica CENA595]